MMLKRVRTITRSCVRKINAIRCKWTLYRLANDTPEQQNADDATIPGTYCVHPF